MWKKGTNKSSGEELAPSSSTKKAHQNRVQLLAIFAPHFFELNKKVDFKQLSGFET
jgi:hypothetical protein